MNKLEFDPEKALGSKILELDRQTLCRLVSKLCAKIREEAGTRDYRGGVYPENICVDEEGNVAIGPASAGDWSGQELQFLPPELYWNGKRGSFSDVYSLGLLLYYAVDRGRLPYEGQCPDPQLRRMDGENIPAPKAAGRRLGEIIEKATRFDSQARYKNVEELQIMLDSLVENQYLQGGTSAEKIFHKSEGELSELERIMVDIIEKGGEEPPPPEEENAQAAENTPIPLWAEKSPEPELPKVQEPSPSQFGSAPARQPIPILTEEKHPELEPVVPGRNAPAVQYGKSAAREKKIAQKAKKRRRPGVGVLVFCAVLIVLALLANALLRDFVWDGGEANPSPTPDLSSLPTIDPGEIIIPSVPDPTATPEPAESTYQIYVEDVSWTEAKARCEALGGHLAVITDAEELNKIVTLAGQTAATRLWIGFHRENAQPVWETGEDVTYYPWDTAAGEPSFVDTYDNVPEDYVMLWYNNGGWYYNDSRNDPVADYPQWYSGTIGYVCEFDGN